MSYAPEILIKVSDDIVIMLRCQGSCIGVGFWNLVKWKINDDGKMIMTRKTSIIHHQWSHLEP